MKDLQKEIEEFLTYVEGLINEHDHDDLIALDTLFEPVNIIKKQQAVIDSLRKQMDLKNIKIEQMDKEYEILNESFEEQVKKFYNTTIPTEPETEIYRIEAEIIIMESF